MGRPSDITLNDEHYQALAHQYYQYLQQLGYHPHTCLSRYYYLREFLSWKEQRGELNISSTTVEQIKAYHQNF